MFHGDSQTTSVSCVDVIAIGIIGKAFEGSNRIHGFCQVAKIIIAVSCSSAFSIHTCGLVAVIVILILCHISGVVDAFRDVTCRIIAIVAGKGEGLAVLFPADGDTGYFIVFVISVGRTFPCTVCRGSCISIGIICYSLIRSDGIGQPGQLSVTVIAVCRLIAIGIRGRKIL